MDPTGLGGVGQVGLGEDDRATHLWTTQVIHGAVKKNPVGFDPFWWVVSRFDITQE